MGISDASASPNPLLTLNGNGNAGNGTLCVINSYAGGLGRLARFGTSPANWVAVLDTTGTWTATAFNTSSDRNVKTNFAEIQAGDILARVAALPISRWNFTNAPGVSHIGPMAQDFHAAFGVGTDDQHIATVDESGVALAAIKGLNEKVEARDAAIAALQKQNNELARQMAELRETVQRLLPAN